MAKTHPFSLDKTEFMGRSSCLSGQRPPHSWDLSVRYDRKLVCQVLANGLQDTLAGVL